MYIFNLLKHEVKSENRTHASMISEQNASTLPTTTQGWGLVQVVTTRDRDPELFLLERLNKQNYITCKMEISY